MKITNKHVFFWNGIYSQWHKALMTIDKIEYSSCEQYMMHQKALLFGDSEIAGLIMNESNPKEQKKYGRMIKGFDKTTWDKNCLAIVYEGNLAKFTQNAELREQMVSTENRIFVEASPFDTIWGIGLSEDAEGIDNPSYWQGLNLLGQALTLVKTKLLSDSKPNENDTRISI
jgi:ribA/ribD-fused uncharacterized protein